MYVSCAPGLAKPVVPVFPVSAFDTETNAGVGVVTQRGSAPGQAGGTSPVWMARLEMLATPFNELATCTVTVTLVDPLAGTVRLGHVTTPPLSVPPLLA